MTKHVDRREAARRRERAGRNRQRALVQSGPSKAEMRAEAEKLFAQFKQRKSI